MRTQSTLVEALWPKARRRIFALLFASPDEEWHLREIARRTDLSPGTVQREITNLHEAGILTRRQVGRQVHYGANRDCPIFDDLRGIVLKTVGLADVLRETLADFEDDISLALIFGSLAHGTDRPESDVDLLIVGDVRMQDLTPVLRNAESRLARPINPVVMTADELSRRIADDDHLITAIRREPTIEILGAANDLNRPSQGES